LLSGRRRSSFPRHGARGLLRELEHFLARRSSSSKRLLLGDVARHALVAPEPALASNIGAPLAL